MKNKRINMSIMNQVILMSALLLVVLVAVVVNSIGGMLILAIGYGTLAIITWALSERFNQKNILTTSLLYLFLVLSSACTTLVLLS